MKMFSIAIVHSSPKYRRPLSVLAAKLPSMDVYSFDGMYFYKPDAWDTEVSNEAQEKFRSIHFDLVLCHLRDRQAGKQLARTVSVWFGGHGESGDPDVGNEEYIYLDVYGSVIQNMPLEIFGPLVSWCQGGDRPRFLDPPDSPAEYSISLSLLCQGYLAHHAGLPENRGDAGIDTKGCANVGKALKSMGWVEDEAATVVSQTVKDFDLSPSESLPDADFWRSPFEGKSLRQGLEEECRSLRQNVQNKIQNGTLEWPDNATLPSRTAKLVEAIEKAIEAKETLAGAATNNKLFDEDFICVVARAYLDLNLLLEAV